MTFMEFLENQGYSHEKTILDQLPTLNLIQQVKLDILLHNNAINNNTFGDFQSFNLAKDSDWKKSLINVFEGKNNDVNLIKNLIKVLWKDIQTHRRMPNPKTGSQQWNQTWIEVYRGWMQKLQSILGEIYGKSQNG